jgi:hypothetical protein
MPYCHRVHHKHIGLVLAEYHALFEKGRAGNDQLRSKNIFGDGGCVIEFYHAGKKG